MQKELSIIELIDLYGKLLPKRQREILGGYYEYDLSLAEIAESMCITRQGVRDALKKAIALLKDYEQRLGLRQIKSELIKAQSADCDQCRAIIAEIIEKI